MKSPQHALGVLLAVLAASVAAAAPVGKDLPLTPQERTELETLKAQLAEPDRSAKTKREAAVLLLNRRYPQASAALRQFLADGSNRPAQIAVAEAVAQSGIAREEFIEPLMAMLTGDEPAVRGPAAGALSVYKNGGVLEAFIKLVSDRGTDRPIRLVIISAMQRVLDKRAVDAFIKLLDDPDEDIRGAACDALTKLTNIRAFGRDPERWKSWWAKNKDKAQSEWLVDLADSLARANVLLENENAALRRRLAQAMNDLYAATAPAGRDALLTEMLKDPVAAVRLAGARVMRNRLTSGEPVGEALRAQVLARLGDADAEVRREAALLLPTAGAAKPVELLTGRLEGEQAPEVREALYQGLGLLRDAAVWGSLVAGIEKEDRRVAAAAAAALARVAERNGADEQRRTAAGEVLRKRYRTAGNDSAHLREALLTAVGALKDKRLAGLLTEALKDAAATIRLSAIKGLEKLGLGEHASALAPLAADTDRGVRLAAISALGALGGTEYLQTLLARTDPRVEPEAAIRQQAWTIAMGLLEKCDADRLKALADQLAQRKDARSELIQLLKLWAGKIPPDRVQQWVPVRLRLGEVLLAAGRPAEAAGELAAVHAALTENDAAQAAEVWLKWIEALLAADDPSGVSRMADSKDAGQSAKALALLTRRLEALKTSKEWAALVRLGQAAERQLGPRLDEARRRQLGEDLRQAQAQLRAADRQRVAALVARLTGADETERRAAEKQLLALKDRAVPPLVGELGKALGSNAPDANAEAAILRLLTRLKPDLVKGYDAGAPLERRRAKVEEWKQQLGS